MVARCEKRQCLYKHGLKEAANDFMSTTTNCVKRVGLYTIQHNPWVGSSELVNKTSAGNVPYVMAGSQCQLRPSEEMGQRVRHAAACPQFLLLMKT